MRRFKKHHGEEDKEKNRFYLLPGMGRHGKRKREMFFKWALLVGFFCALLLAGVLYLINVQSRPGF